MDKEINYRVKQFKDVLGRKNFLLRKRVLAASLMSFGLFKFYDVFVFPSHL